MAWSKERQLDGLNEQQRAKMVRAQNELLDDAVSELSLKNDAALARAMLITPPVISKFRHGKLGFSSPYIIILHELTDWPVADIKAQLGLPTIHDLHAANAG